MQYADVAVAARTGMRDTILTYAIPAELLPRLAVGAVVEVPFQTKLRTGVLYRLRRELPAARLRTKLRPLRRVLSAWPVLSAGDLALREELAAVTFTPLGHSLTLGLPPRSLLKAWTHPPPTPMIDARKQTFWLAVSPGPSAFQLEISQTLARGATVAVIVPTQDHLTVWFEACRRQWPTETLIWQADASVAKQQPIWEAARDGLPRLIIGTRSAVLLPFRRLDLMIVDTPSHPQMTEEQLPAYSVLSVAELRTKLCGGHLLAIDSLPPLRLLTKHGRRNWHFRQTTSRSKPELAIIAREPGQPLATGTIARLREGLAGGEHILVVVRASGWARGVICADCATLTRCPTCRHGLIATREQQAVCPADHPPPKMADRCAVCQSLRLRPFGWGSQRWFQFFGQTFPGVRIATEKTHTELREDTVWQIAIFVPKFSHLPPAQADRVVAIEPEQFLLGTTYSVREDWYRLLLDLHQRAGKELIIETSIPEHAFWTEMSKPLPTRAITGELTLRKQAGFPPYGKLLEITFPGLTARALPALVERLHTSVRSVLGEVVMLGGDESSDEETRQPSARVLVRLPDRFSPRQLAELRARLPRQARLLVSS